MLDWVFMCTATLRYLYINWFNFCIFALGIINMSYLLAVMAYFHVCLNMRISLIVMGVSFGKASSFNFLNSGQKLA